MHTTSNCDVTKTAHHKQMTTICHWMKPPAWKFSAHTTVPELVLWYQFWYYLLPRCKFGHFGTTTFMWIAVVWCYSW